MGPPVWTVRAAPAKLNLALEVTRRREDGYHELVAVAQTIDWTDLVGWTPDRASAPAGAPGPSPVHLSGTAADGLDGARENLVATAARALADAGAPPPPGRFWLWKRIPVGSGLGGGSADAAAALQLLGAGHADAQGRAATRLGADVPFALCQGTALVTGIGDRLEVLPPLRDGWFVVVVLARVITADAYRRTAAADFSAGDRARALAEHLRGGGHPTGPLCGSALEAAAGRAVAALPGRAQALRAGVPDTWWAMTGSGGAYFTWAPARAAAAAHAAAARAACPEASIRLARPVPPP